MGKVAAAATTVTLVREFRRGREIRLHQLAGGIGADTRVGDVVVADRTLQHDLDARPFFGRA
ncbi:phosphorylase family protein [Cupriavidus basilensis]